MYDDPIVDHMIAEQRSISWGPVLPFRSCSSRRRIRNDGLSSNASYAFLPSRMRRIAAMSNSL